VPRHTAGIVRGGVMRSLSAALVVLGTAGAAPAFLPLAPDPAAASVPASQERTRRAFEHRYHEELPCRSCHGSGATHRMTVIRAPQDCDGCHHDPGRGFACSRCHSAGALAPVRPVPMPLTLRVAAAARTRTVAFQHAVHLAAETGIVCGDCHGSGASIALNRDCGSCHASHHGGRAECAQCHTRPAAEVHTRAAHLSCSAGTCHAPATAPTPASSREVCLFCHDKQREHEADGTCALCHRIPGARGSPGQGPGGGSALP